MNKKFVFCLLLLTFYVSLFTFDVIAQQPTQEWVRRYSGTSNNGSSGLSVKLDGSSNVYVLVRVYTDSTLDDYGVIKYSPTGVLLWQAIYNTPGNFQDQAKAFAVTSTGEIYVTGISGIDFVYRILTVKFNSDGVFQWAKVYNGGGPGDGAYDIAIERQENIVITGATSINSNTGYALMVKYNQLGDSLWVRKFDLFQRSVSSKLVIDDSSNVYLTGYHVVSLTQENYLTLKYNRNGTLMWFNSYGFPPDGGEATCIAIDSNRNVYVVGTMYNPMPEFTDNVLLKIDPDGDTLWSRIYSGIGGNHQCSVTPTGVSVKPNGNSIYYATASGYQSGAEFVTLGYNSSGDSIWVRRYPIGGIGTPQFNPANLILDKFNNIYITGSAYFSPGGDDYVAIRYSPNGLQQWVATYNGPLANSFDHANDLTIDTALNVYVTGSSSWQNNPIRWDAATIKYSQVIGISSNNNRLPHKFVLEQNYPNPFNSTTIISYALPEKSHVTLSVYSITGELLKVLVDSEHSSGYYSIGYNAWDMASGVYFYTLITENNLLNTKKFIVLK